MDGGGGAGVSAAIAALVADVAQLGRGERAGEAVAARLAPLLGLRGLLGPAQLVEEADNYARHLIAADPVSRTSVWAMVWRLGQASPIHDHRCWCTVGVVSGELTETAYRLGPDGPRALCERTLRPGAAVTLAPGDDGIHRVANLGACTAVSIHVYGFDPAEAPSSAARVWTAAA